jgi:hypothetical protein
VARSHLRRLASLFAPLVIAFLFLGGGLASADESQRAIPDLHRGTFQICGKPVTAWNLRCSGHHGHLLLPGAGEGHVRDLLIPDAQDVLGVPGEDSD